MQRPNGKVAIVASVRRRAVKGIALCIAEAEATPYTTARGVTQSELRQL
jgi:hypothetical protein